MENKILSHVTIPLEDYENMKKKIADLEKQLKQKEVIIYLSRWQEFHQLLPMIFILALMVAILKFNVLF